MRQSTFGGEFGKQANNGADEVRKEVYKKIRQLEFKVVNSVKLMNIKYQRCDPLIFCRLQSSLNRHSFYKREG